MRIRTRLSLATLVSCGAALLVGVIFTVVVSRINELEHDSGEHLALMQDTAELELLTYEFFRDHQERPRVQWLRKYDTIMAQFEALRMHDHAANENLEPIARDLVELKNLFVGASAAATAVGAKNETPDETRRALERRLVNRIFILTRGIASGTAAIETQARRDAIAYLATSRALILGFIGALVVFLAITTLAFGRSVTAPLRRLQEGIAIVGGGDLGHRLGGGRDDEFGDLARAFDEMTLRLASVLASRDELEREVAARERAQENLARSNKELEQFAYVASHDLQEPLRMVSSFTQLLAQRYEGQLDEKAQKYIRYAVDGAVRMQRLINDLLSYSRVATRGKPLEPTDTHAVLGEALRNLATLLEEQRAIVTTDELPTVPADASQLTLLFQNLVSNAVKFHGAEVPPRAHVSARDAGAEWVFSVRDNGIGIDRQYAERIFVIFQRLHTREEYPGTGIGLAVCKRIVERHGGRIWFEPAPGGGTTFFFTLPKQPSTRDL